MDGRRVVRTADAPKPIGPYGQGIITGDLLFTVGVIGNDPASSELVPGGIAQETAQALRNLGTILEAGGSGLDLIVKATIYLANIADQEVITTQWEGAIRAPHPALTIVAVGGMPLGAGIEIECVAVLSQPSR